MLTEAQNQQSLIT